MIVNALATRNRQAWMPSEPFLTSLDVKVRIESLAKMALQSLQVSNAVRKGLRLAGERRANDPLEAVRSPGCWTPW